MYLNKKKLPQTEHVKYITMQKYISIKESNLIHARERCTCHRSQQKTNNNIQFNAEANLDLLQAVGVFQGGIDNCLLLIDNKMYHSNLLLNRTCSILSNINTEVLFKSRTRSLVKKYRYRMYPPR